MILWRTICLLHILILLYESSSMALLAFQNVAYVLGLSPARHRMYYRRSGDDAREGRALSTVLWLRYTHEFSTIYTLCALVFTYYTSFYPQLSSVDLKTYFRLFVDPATSASEARSMRMLMQSCALTGAYNCRYACRFGAKLNHRRPAQVKPG